MKTLLLLRHAKSSWSEPALDDHERPLKGRGRRDAPRIGRLLRDEGLLPQLIVSSTAVRARTTAELVAEACDYDGELRLDDALYLAEPETYVNAIVGLPDGIERVMFVGHNPGMEDLVAELSGRRETMPTAALAVLALPVDAWSALAGPVRGSLARLWRPRELAGDAG